MKNSFSGIHDKPSVRDSYIKSEEWISTVFNRVYLLVIYLFGAMYLLIGYISPIIYLIMGNRDPDTWMTVFDQFM